MQNLALKAYAWAQTRRQPREEGQTVIEYALIVAVVSIALIGIMAGFGSDLVQGAKDKLADFIPS